MYFHPIFEDGSITLSVFGSDESVSAYRQAQEKILRDHGDSLRMT